jgi:hypothetical protein
VQGYIKLYRQMINWEWYTDGNTMRVFLHLLLLANHADKRWQGQEIKAGQLVTSISSLSKALKLTVKQIRTAVKHLENTEEIAIKTTNRFTLITIANWASYQGMDNERASETTNKGQTEGKQRATNKNDKNVKNEISNSTEQTSCSMPVVNLPLNDGTEFGVDQGQVDKWKELYPAVDVLSELRKMIGWLDANPKKRKTRTGITRFANNWLARQQDKPQVGGTTNAPLYKCAD